MKYGFVPGQLYPADWDISPEGEDGKYVVSVPLNIFSAELSAKQRQVDYYNAKAA